MIKITIVAKDAVVLHSKRSPVRLEPGQAAEVRLDDDEKIFVPPVLRPTIDFPPGPMVDVRGGKVPAVEDAQLVKQGGSKRAAVELKVGGRLDTAQLRGLGGHARNYDLFVIAKE